MSKREYSKNEIIKIILKTIAGLGLATILIAAPGLSAVMPMFNLDGSKDRRRFRRSLTGLENQKYIKLYDKGGKHYLKMTERGKRKLLQFDYDNLSIRRPKKWDGMWRLVLFDIPHKNKKTRDAIRLKLKELFFYRIQKSSFISPYECKEEISFIKDYWNMSKEIDYFLVKDVNSDKNLKKVFGLK
jgi:DNA-binding transcriptional regulator PaaX